LIDIHSHVLYGLDDGARTLETSVAMLRMARESGTTAIVATPHANPQYSYDVDVIERKIEDLRPALPEGLEIYRGCDFHLSYDNIQDAISNPRKYTINQGPYLLVEFSDLLIFRNTAEIFSKLRNAGMIPIITHPERNSLLRQRLEQIASWVAEGAVNQVTAGSLLGAFGKRAQDFAKLLLERNLLHIIASDAHDLEHRPPRMDLAFDWLKQHAGEEIARVACITNPSRTLTGAPLELPQNEVSVARRKWYKIWR
jgi:protein-tyrosine phosphatase